MYSLSQIAAPAQRRYWLRQFLEATIFFCISIVCLRMVMQTFHIDGQSMEPTLHDQEYVFVYKAAYLFRPPARGDIIVFQYPLNRREDYIKRIIAIPGDILSVNGEVVTVDGVTLYEPYINRIDNSNPFPSFIKRIIGPNEYFVMGDNRGNSSDSRLWGFVPRENIIGKALAIYWPWNGNNLGLLPDSSAVFAHVYQTGR